MKIILSLFLLAYVPLLAAALSNNVLSPSDVQKISKGGVAVINNFIPETLIEAMKKDARYLFDHGEFTPDGLTNTAVSKEKQGFTARADRQTFRGGADWNSRVGDYEARSEFGTIMKNLRTELSQKLDRPSLNVDGERRHEMTYNWYEPGAKLGRHLDEHHEETKGVKGWLLGTRRSVTWLVYLNDNWSESEGGALRCYPRNGLSKNPVGCHEGNLQVGWMDEFDPIYLDCFRKSGQSALYRVVNGKRDVLSVRDFDVPSQPIEFQKFLPDLYKDRFEQISTARLDSRFANVNGNSDASIAQASLLADKSEDHFMDVIPKAGTLVLFDSVSLPHLVQEVTAKRQRIAATGWFHEDSQFLLDV